jgi:hypothetical protein
MDCEKVQKRLAEYFAKPGPCFDCGEPTADIGMVTGAGGHHYGAKRAHIFHRCQKCLEAEIQVNNND